MLALKSGPQIAAKVGNPAGLLCRRIWYSVGKSGVLGIVGLLQTVHSWANAGVLFGARVGRRVVFETILKTNSCQGIMYY